MRGFPPSTANLIAALCERAGPGPFGKGDISGVFSVLVAASDMDEPIADITRGVLDGHVVLDRGIAERGRFPAIDVRRSVSRSLPGIATEEENALLARMRRVLTAYENAALMIQTGLYAPGSDPAHRRGDPALAEARRLRRRALARGGRGELRPARRGARVGRRYRRNSRRRLLMRG